MSERVNGLIILIVMFFVPILGSVFDSSKKSITALRFDLETELVWHF